MEPRLDTRHFLLAAAGLLIWIVYLANDKDAFKWIAFGIVVAAALSASRCSRSGSRSTSAAKDRCWTALSVDVWATAPPAHADAAAVTAISGATDAHPANRDPDHEIVQEA